MLSFKQFLFESTNWDIIDSPSEKMNNKETLIKLVDIAYSKTKEKSFIKTTDDVIQSIWHVVDVNSDNEYDGTIVVRRPNPNENWDGNKVRAIGHNGNPRVIRIVYDRLSFLLQRDDYWIEASDRMKEILLKYYSEVPVVTDIDLIRKIFNDSTIEMIDDVSYTRSINGKTYQETIFGNPRLK